MSEYGIALPDEQYSQECRHYYVSATGIILLFLRKEYLQKMKLENEEYYEQLTKNYSKTQTTIPLDSPEKKSTPSNSICPSPH